MTNRSAEAYYKTWNQERLRQLKMRRGKMQTIAYYQFLYNPLPEPELPILKAALAYFKRHYTKQTERQIVDTCYCKTLSDRASIAIKYQNSSWVPKPSNVIPYSHFRSFSHINAEFLRDVSQRYGYNHKARSQYQHLVKFIREGIDHRAITFGELIIMANHMNVYRIAKNKVQSLETCRNVIRRMRNNKDHIYDDVWSSLYSQFGQQQVERKLYFGNNPVLLADVLSKEVKDAGDPEQLTINHQKGIN